MPRLMIRINPSGAGSGAAAVASGAGTGPSDMIAGGRPSGMPTIRIRMLGAIRIRNLLLEVAAIQSASFIGAWSKVRIQAMTEPP